MIVSERNLGLANRSSEIALLIRLSEVEEIWAWPSEAPEWSVFNEDVNTLIALKCLGLQNRKLPYLGDFT